MSRVTRFFPLALLSLIGMADALPSGSYCPGHFNSGMASSPPPRRRRAFKGWQREMRRRGRK